MSQSSHQVQTLGPDHVPAVVDVMCESFFEYPVMRYVLGSPPDYEEQLRTMVTFFVMARVHRGETLLGVADLGVADAANLSGAALVSYPGRTEAPPALSELQEITWGKLGSQARSRYDAFGKACGPIGVDVPHIHLNMIGARRSAQGKGVGRALMEAVHHISQSDEQSQGVSLSTEREQNLPLYAHFGYKIIGSATVSPQLTTWGLYRPDPAK